jgi:hypothetical protein
LRHSARNPETRVDPVESANTGLFGATPGNLCGAVSDWWSN